MRHTIEITSKLDLPKQLTFVDRRSANEFLADMVKSFPRQTKVVMTDLNQYHSVSFPLTGSLYTIKKG